MRNPSIILIALICVLFAGIAYAAPKQRNYQYEVLALSTKPFYMNGKLIKKGDRINGKTILALNNTQAIRLRQIRNDGRRVVFTIGPKSIKRNETINAVFKRKFTSSKGAPNDLGELLSNETNYLIDSISFPAHLASDCWIEVQSANGNNVPCFKVYPKNDTIFLTSSMFGSLSFGDEERLRVTCTNGKNTILITDGMTIIYLSN